MPQPYNPPGPVPTFPVGPQPDPAVARERDIATPRPMPWTMADCRREIDQVLAAEERRGTPFVRAIGAALRNEVERRALTALQIRGVVAALEAYEAKRPGDRKIAWSQELKARETGILANFAVDPGGNPEAACRAMSNDPTRLDPPIAIRLGDAIPGPEWPRLLGHLLRVTGAIDDQGWAHREHDKAARGAFDRLPDLCLLLTHLSAEGVPTFALAPEQGPAADVHAAALAREQEREEGEARESTRRDAEAAPELPAELELHDPGIF